MSGIVKKTRVGGLVGKGTGVNALRRAAKADERTRSKESVFLVLDVSGSMAERIGGGSTLNYGGVTRGGDRKIDALHHAATAFVDACSSRSQVGVITFDDKCQVLQDLTVHRHMLKSALDSMAIGYGTHIGDGLALALDRLRHARAEIERIILMTDGDDRNRENPSALDDAIATAATRGVIVDCVAFGDNADTKTLDEISRKTGGVVKDARSADELVKAFKQLEAGARGLLGKGE